MTEYFAGDGPISARAHRIALGIVAFLALATLLWFGEVLRIVTSIW